MCQSMVNIQSPTAEIRRGKKKEEERNYRMKILWSALLHRATIIKNKWHCVHSCHTSSCDNTVAVSTVQCNINVNLHLWSESSPSASGCLLHYNDLKDAILPRGTGTGTQTHRQDDHRTFISQWAHGWIYQVCDAWPVQFQTKITCVVNYLLTGTHFPSDSRKLSQCNFH